MLFGEVLSTFPLELPGYCSYFWFVLVSYEVSNMSVGHCHGDQVPAMTFEVWSKFLHPSVLLRLDLKPSKSWSCKG